MRTKFLARLYFSLLLLGGIGLTGCEKDEEAGRNMTEAYRIARVLYPEEVSDVEWTVRFPCVIRSKEQLAVVFKSVSPRLAQVDYSRYSVVIDRGAVRGSSEHAFHRISENVYQYSHATAYLPLYPDLEPNLPWSECTGILVDRLPDSVRVVSEYKQYVYGEVNEPFYPLLPYCPECFGLPDSPGFIRHPGIHLEEAGEVEWIFYLGEGESACLKVGDGKYHITVDKIMDNYSLHAFMTVNNKGFGICSEHPIDQSASKGFPEVLDYYKDQIASGQLDTRFSKQRFSIGHSLSLYFIGRVFGQDPETGLMGVPRACFVLTRK